MSEENYKKEWEEATKTIPEEYKPISMWGYFGYEILFMIPCIGFILLLVFSFGGTRNYNLRNFARSYFCVVILIVVIIVIIFIIVASISSTTRSLILMGM